MTTIKYVKQPSNPSKRIFSIMLGVVFIAGGLFLMADFLIKFLKFVIGIICVMIGLQFLWRR
ncbi:hypothetical protein HY488_03660 [Candidatus Woesearchaeota archaeon]|nr:hypothetical protein [Candidatus Woesearchaeota archaeon]